MRLWLLIACSKVPQQPARAAPHISTWPNVIPLMKVILTRNNHLFLNVGRHHEDQQRSMCWRSGECAKSIRCVLLEKYILHNDVGSLFILLYTVLTNLLGHLSQGPSSMMTWFDCGLFHFLLAFDVLNRNEIIEIMIILYDSVYGAFTMGKKNGFRRVSQMEGIFNWLPPLPPK